MGRPKKSKADSTVRISISVPASVKAMAEKTGNASAFFTASAQMCKGVAENLAKIEAQRVEEGLLLEVIDEIIDLCAIWERVGEKTVPFEDFLRQLERKKGLEKLFAPMISQHKPRASISEAKTASTAKGRRPA